MKVSRTYLAILLAGLCTTSLFARAEDKPAPPSEDYVKAHYTKYEYAVPMRDGVKLFTSVYAPKDDAQTYPILMDRTPYSVAPYVEDQYKKSLGPSDEFEKAGYIFVYQDVRGRYLSGGKFVEMHPHIDVKKTPQDVDDSSDMYDTVSFCCRTSATTTARSVSGASPIPASTPRPASSTPIPQSRPHRHKRP